MERVFKLLLCVAMIPGLVGFLGNQQKLRRLQREAARLEPMVGNLDVRDPSKPSIVFVDGNERKADSLGAFAW